MNGIHDMGGMHGMGPIRHEENQPVFHEAWEGRLYAIDQAIRAWRKWSIDERRHSMESLPPTEYLSMSYYEKWIATDNVLLVKHGLVTQEEIDTGKPAPGSQKMTPPLTAEAARSALPRRQNFRRPNSDASARFKVGDPVRARKINPEGHTRLPRYARGREGVVARYHGIFVFPDTNAHSQGEHPGHLYSVRFSARELWGESASPRDSVHLDMWDNYLEHA
jgi:nitrile hydratase subunit beta